MFIPTVTYIVIFVSPWLRIITEALLSTACKNINPPTIERYCPESSSNCPLAPIKLRICLLNSTSPRLITIPNIKLIVSESAAIREAFPRFSAPKYCEISTALAPEITVKTIVTIDTA